jgi:hypothetical protein
MVRTQQGTPTGLALPKRGPQRGFRFTGLAAMAIVLTALVGAPGLADAQYYYPPPPPPPSPYYYPPPPPPYRPRRPTEPPDDLNILRLQVGIDGVSTGYYCYSTYPYYGTCYNWFGEANLIVRGAAELNLGGPGFVMLGFDFLPSLTATPAHVFYEPTLDFGVSIRRWRSPVRSRFYLGFGLPIADTGQVGSVFRLGGGLSFRVAPGFAFGGDLVWSIGGINGYFVSALGLAVGPELTW